MPDSNSATVGLFALLAALGTSACGADNDKSNPVPVKDAGADAPTNALTDAAPDAVAPVDAGVDAAQADAADAGD